MALPATDGGPRTVYVTYAPDQDDTGAVTGFVAAIIDITARKQAQDALARTMNALTEAQAIAGLGSFEYFPATQKLVWSAQTKRLHGLDENGPEPTFEAMVAMIVPQDREPVLAAFESFMKGVGPGQWDYRITLPGGTIRHLNTKAKFESDANGQTQRVVGTTQDITERQAAQAARSLAVANAELSMALNTARLGTLVVDPVHQTGDWNDRAFDLLGVPTQDRRNPMAMTAFMSRIDPADLDAAHACHAATWSQGQCTAEFRLHGYDGAQRLIATQTILQRLTDDTPGRMLVVLRDITEERAQAQAMEQALAAAKAGDKAKSDFLNVISHEIRTPLNGVMGMLQLLEMQPQLEPDCRRYAQEAYKSSQLLLTILNDVLDYGGLQKGRLSVQPAPMYLSQLPSYLQQLRDSLVFQHGVVFLVEGHLAGDLLVLADELRLKQILLNLVNNAVKFTSKGSIKAAVMLDTVGANSAQVKLIVADTGLGMSEQTQASLFTPFMQADMSMTRQYGGTGLGLAIVKGLVDEMGGRIEVDSHLHAGSTFSIYLSLPLADAAGLAPGQASQVPAQVRALQANEDAKLLALQRTTEYAAQQAELEQPQAPAKSMREELQALVGKLEGVHVLVVEDDPSNAQVVATMLQTTGARTTLSYNAQAALDVLADPGCGVDVVLMDLQMPRMNGIEATRALRTSQALRLQAIPIIGLSGNIMRGEPQLALEAGMQGFLAKPADLQSMVGEICAVLGR